MLAVPHMGSCMDNGAAANNRQQLSLLSLMGHNSNAAKLRLVSLFCIDTVFFEGLHGVQIYLYTSQ